MYSAVVKRLLHPEQIDPNVRYGKSNLYVSTVNIRVRIVGARNCAFASDLHLATHYVHVASDLQW